MKGLKVFLACFLCFSIPMVIGWFIPADLGDSGVIGGLLMFWGGMAYANYIF